MPTIPAKFKIGYGLEKDLPNLEDRELGYTKDTGKIVLRVDKGNVELAKQALLDKAQGDLQGNINQVNSNLQGQINDVSNKSDNAVTKAQNVQDQFNRVVAEAGSNNPEVVQARGNEVNLNARLDKIDSSSSDSAKKLGYKAVQTEMLSKFYYKLMTKQNVKGVCEGDSLTYGHDVTSPDKRPTATTLTDNGVAHYFTRASMSYPEQLQTNLRSIFGTTSTIINKGYSGDYANLSYQHWNRNENADFAMVMLGTNDANDDSYIPVNKQKNVQAFIQDMRTIIERFLNWNTPVFLLAPPRTQQPETATTTSRYVEPWRKAMDQLAIEYGCPFIDFEEFCNGLDNTFYSDGLHFNGKGYSYLANRLTSVFIGLSSKYSVYPNSVIGIRPTRDNYVVNGATFSNATNSNGAEEGDVQGSSLLATINPGNSMILSFYAETDDLILIPIHGLISGATAKYTLDNGSQQGSVPLLTAVNTTYNKRTYPPSSITSTMPTNTTEAFDGTINPSTITNFLHITNKGYHTIKIENGAVAGSVLFQGFVVRSFRDFANGNIIDDTTFQPTLAGTTATGNPTYNTRVSRLKKMGNLINHFVTMNITVDATLAGSVYVLLSNKVENLTNLKVFVPIYQGHGIFTDSTVVTGVMFANSQYLYLQKIVNGVVSNLTGADIQGKTIELTFTAIYTSI